MDTDHGGLDITVLSGRPAKRSSRQRRRDVVPAPTDKAANVNEVGNAALLNEARAAFGAVASKGRNAAPTSLRFARRAIPVVSVGGAFAGTAVGIFGGQLTKAESDVVGAGMLIGIPAGLATGWALSAGLGRLPRLTSGAARLVATATIIGTGYVVAGIAAASTIIGSATGLARAIELVDGVLLGLAIFAPVLVPLSLAFARARPDLPPAQGLTETITATRDEALGWPVTWHFLGRAIVVVVWVFVALVLSFGMFVVLGSIDPARFELAMDRFPGLLALLWLTAWLSVTAAGSSLTIRRLTRGGDRRPR